MNTITVPCLTWSTDYRTIAIILSPCRFQCQGKADLKLFYFYFGGKPFSSGGEYAHAPSYINKSSIPLFLFKYRKKPLGYGGRKKRGGNNNEE